MQLLQSFIPATLNKIIFGINTSMYIKVQTNKRESIVNCYYGMPEQKETLNSF